MIPKIAALLLATFPAFSTTLHAQTIKLQSATQQKYSDGLHRERIYIASSAQHPRFKFKLSAVSGGSGIWWLALEALNPRQAGQATFGRDEILGPDGLLSKCIGRFIADVPGTNVRAVTFEAVDSGPLWAGAMGTLTPLFKKWDGKLVQAPGDQDVDRSYTEWNTLTRALRRSPQPKEVARQIAMLLNERLLDAGPCIGDDHLVGYDFDLAHTTWAQRLKLPNYGIAVQSVIVAVELKPK